MLFGFVVLIFSMGCRKEYHDALDFMVLASVSLGKCELLVCLACRTVLQYFSSRLEMWHSLFLLLALRDLISETMVSGQTCQCATLVHAL